MRSRSRQTRRTGFSNPESDPTVFRIFSLLWSDDSFCFIIQAT
jgi:hypothetical protein